MRLNQFLAHAGICSRRKADELIQSGAISVNGTIIKTVGATVTPEDKVVYRGRVVRPEPKVYVLLNKPTGFITSVSDEEGRPTVLDLVKLPKRARLYPVGRLDYSTSGALLLTNDGELALKLSHPRFAAPKTYQVALSAPLTPDLIERLKKGIALTEGTVAVDHLEENPRKPTECKVEIHSGQTRVIRRIFEQVGRRVTKLHRVKYAGLTLRGMALGQWRFLTNQEVAQLQAQAAKQDKGERPVVVKKKKRVIKKRPAKK